MRYSDKPVMHPRGLVIGLVISVALWAGIIGLVMFLVGCTMTEIVAYECRDYTIHVDTTTFGVDSVTYTVRDTVETREDC